MTLHSYASGAQLFLFSDPLLQMQSEKNNKFIYLINYALLPTTMDWCFFLALGSDIFVDTSSIQTSHGMGSVGLIANWRNKKRCATHSHLLDPYLCVLSGGRDAKIFIRHYTEI